METTIVIIEDEHGLPRAWATSTTRETAKARAEAEWAVYIEEKAKLGGEKPIRGKTHVQTLPEQRT